MCEKRPHNVYSHHGDFLSYVKYGCMFSEISLINFLVMILLLYVLSTLRILKWIISYFGMKEFLSTA